MSEHTIFVDTTDIEYMNADDEDKAWLARGYELGDRAMGFAQSLLLPPMYRYEVLLGQMRRSQ